MEVQYSVKKHLYPATAWIQVFLDAVLHFHEKPDTHKNTKTRRSTKTEKGSEKDLARLKKKTYKTSSKRFAKTLDRSTRKLCRLCVVCINDFCRRRPNSVIRLHVVIGRPLRGC